MRTPDLLSVAQAADALGIPPRTLQWRIKAGKVAATKVGDGITSSYAITRQEVDRLIAEAAEKASA